MAGLAIETASSESPSADWPTAVPAELYTVRSRSAAVSETLPMATSREVAPAGTSTVVVWVTPSVMVGRVVSEEPSGPPFNVPSSAA